MPNIDKIQARVAKNNPQLTQKQIDRRAMNQYNKKVAAKQGSLGATSNDPLAKAATQLYKDIQGIGGGSNGDFSNILSQIGSGGGGYSPVSYSPVSAGSVGGIRDVSPGQVNMNMDALRNALTASAQYNQGQNLAALDARVAQGGLPGSSRHGIAQANVMADTNRQLQEQIADVNYRAYDADAARRLSAAQGNQQGDIASMNANAQLQAAAMAANASLGGQAMSSNAMLQAAAMQDATSRLGIAGNIANNQADIALRRSGMLADALGQAYDRSMGYRAMDNQAITELMGQQYGYQNNLNNLKYGYNTNLDNLKYGLLNNQQDRSLQYNMFGDNMDYQKLAMLAGMADAKNGTMMGGLGMSGNMSGLSAAQLSPYASYMDLLGPYAGALGNPITLGNASGNSMGISMGNSNGFGMVGGGGAADSVICTYLNKIGMLDDITYAADSLAGQLIKEFDKDAYDGYYVWAEPLVRRMEGSLGLTRVVSWFAIPWAKEMSYIMGHKKKGSILGKLVMNIGLPVCRFIGKLINTGEDDVRTLC